MENNIIGAVAILLGCTVIVFRKRFAQGNVQFQNEVFNFRFAKSPTVDIWIITIVGLIFIVFGALTLFRII